MYFERTCIIIFDIRFSHRILLIHVATKRKYSELTIDNKKEMLDKIDKWVSYRKLAQEFGISTWSIAYITQHKDVLRLQKPLYLTIFTLLASAEIM